MFQWWVRDDVVCFSGGSGMMLYASQAGQE